MAERSRKARTDQPTALVILFLEFDQVRLTAFRNFLMTDDAARLDILYA